MRPGGQSTAPRQHSAPWDLWGHSAPLTAWPPGPPLPPRPPQTLRQTTESSAPSEATPGSRVRVKSHQARILGWCPQAQVHHPLPLAGHLTQQSSRSRAGHKGNGGGLGQPHLNGKKIQGTWAPQGAIQATTAQLQRLHFTQIVKGAPWVQVMRWPLCWEVGHFQSGAPGFLPLLA